MTELNPIVYLPIESKSRELNARLLQAAYLMRIGLDVVMGVGHEISQNLDQLPSGVFLAKGLNAVQRDLLRDVGNHGHVAVVIDEECLGVADPWYMMRDVAPDVDQYVQAIYCQGRVQRDALATHRGIPEQKLLLTGNPRVDLMREPLRSLDAEEADTIRRRAGPFILVNTNSGSINNLWGGLDVYRRILTDIGWADPSREEDRLLVEDHIEHDRNNIEAVKRFVTGVAERAPELRLVLRPHPSEKPDSWMAFAEDVPSLSVVTDTDLAPWLLAADLVVTTGCTTASEAVLMETDAISLVVQPNTVRHPGYFLANQVALRLTNVAEAVDTAIARSRGDRSAFEMTRSTRERALADHVHFEADTWAYQAIGDHIRSLVTVPAGPIGDRARVGKLNRRRDLKVSRVAWEKAFFTGEDASARLSRILRLLGWEFSGQIHVIGHGTYLFTAAR